MLSYSLPCHIHRLVTMWADNRLVLQLPCSKEAGEMMNCVAVSTREECLAVAYLSSRTSGDGVSGTVIWLPKGASGSLRSDGSSTFADSSSSRPLSDTDSALKSLVPACKHMPCN